MKYLIRLLVLPAVTLLLLFPAPLRADIYQIFNLGNDNGRGIAGIDDSGTVVTFYVGCAASGGNCYYTVNQGVVVGSFESLPNLAYDNGVACEPRGDVALSVCNGDLHAFGTKGASDFSARGLFVGPYSSPTYLAGGAVVQLYLNSYGDIAWSDGSAEFMYEAYDVTAHAPEPTSFLLLGTGLLSVFAGKKRRHVS